VVALLPIMWLVVSPFAFAALVCGSSRVNRQVARHLPLALAAGWLGVAMVLAGAFLVEGTTGRVLLLVGAPLEGLSFWMRGGGDDDGREDDDPEDGPEPVDWERFLDDIDRWRREHERSTVGR
jgi:hypothetical protein